MTSAAGRVVVLDHTAKEGGAEIALLRLAPRLRSADGIDVRVLLFEDGPLVGRLRAAGVPTVVLPLSADVAEASRGALGAAGVRSALAAAAFVPRLVRALRGSGADLVVANSLKSAVFAAVAAPLAGIPWVWHLHDRLASDYLSTPARLAMRALAAWGPRRIVVNSRATLDTLPPRAQRRARVAHPGLDEALFARSGDAARAASHPRVGLVGRISPTKGQREFLEAAAVVAPRHPEASFVVVGGALFGEDDYAAGLEHLADRLGLAGRVEFTGWVDDPAAAISALTLVVHASPVPEPFGQVVAEAMALGVPVVATAAGGVPEIIAPDAEGAPDAYGVLVPPGDVAALAHAIDAAITDPARASERAAAAQQVARRFGIGATADVVREVWSEALGGRGAAQAPARTASR